MEAFLVEEGIETRDFKVANGVIGPDKPLAIVIPIDLASIFVHFPIVTINTELNHGESNRLKREIDDSKKVRW